MGSAGEEKKAEEEGRLGGNVLKNKSFNVRIRRGSRRIQSLYKKVGRVRRSGRSH